MELQCLREVDWAVVVLEVGWGRDRGGGVRKAVSRGEHRGRAGDWGGGRGWRGSCLVLMRSCVSCRDRIKGDISEHLEKINHMAPLHLYTNVYTPILSSAGFHLNRVSKVMFRKYIFELLCCCFDSSGELE